MTKTFKTMVFNHIKKDRKTTEHQFSDADITRDYRPLVIKSKAGKKSVTISRVVIKDLQDIHKMFVDHAGIKQNDPDNVWHPNALMFILGQKNKCISQLELLKVKGNGCAYMSNVPPATMAKGLYSILKKGYEFAGVARVVLCYDAQTEVDDHIFGKLHNKGLSLVSLTTKGFSVKVPDEKEGNLIKVGYKIK